MEERLTWNEIKRKYPHQIVGLVDCIPDDLNFESAIVKYSTKDTSYYDILEKLFIKKEKMFVLYTTLDEDSGVFNNEDEVY